MNAGWNALIDSGRKFIIKIINNTIDEHTQTTSTMTVTTTTIIIITLHNRLMASTVADKCIISEKLTPFTLMIWDIGRVIFGGAAKYDTIKRKT